MANFALFPELHARSKPQATAIVDRRLRLTWAALDAEASRFAHYLREQGVGIGERVAIWLPNRAEAVIAFLGSLKSGAVPVPLNWRLQGPDLARLVDHCGPRVAVIEAQRPDIFAGRSDCAILSAGERAHEGTFWDALEGRDSVFAARGCQAADTANLMYTSGTTTTPKAAIHTHGMRLAIAAAMTDCFRLSALDVALAVSPLFHTSGMSVLSNALFTGCPLILQDRWDLAEVLAAIERERVTFMHVIGTIVVDIARAPESMFTRDVSSMRFAWGGGHSLDGETLASFERRMHVTFLQGYARTEGGLAYNPLDAARRRFDANGYGNRNSSDLAIVDPATGSPVARGDIGEIVVRGDGVTPGYWDGGMTRVPLPYDGGWQPTGDFGRFDETGSLHFLGRRDHMIKTGGENVYPAEVEAVLLAMPDVSDAVVLGVADERLGHRVAALIVPRHAKVTATDVDRACRSVLGGFKIPRTIRLVDELPRLGTQKVDLEACRALLNEPSGTA